MENKQPKIALFMLPLLTQGGGAEKYFIELARNLNERGFPADIITMNEKYFRKFARLLHIFVLGNFFGKININGRESEKDIEIQLGKARWIKSGYKDLRNKLNNYDIIYSKNELSDLILLRSIGFKNLPSVIIGVHTPISYPETKSLISKAHNITYSSLFYRWLIRRAKCVHVSNSSAKDFTEKKLRINSELIFYPFSAQHIFDSSRKNRSTFEFNKDKKNIIFSGRLGEQKGIDALLNSIHKIIQQGDMVEKMSINIFGSGDEKYESSIRKLAEKHSFIKYFGHVENKFIPHILGQQDLMIAPSRWETLPYSVLEAQAMGVPVVAFDIPGPSDIIENGKTGFLVKNNNELFEKVKSFVEGEISFDKNEIIQNIEKKFDPKKIYPELIGMFEKYL